MSDEVLKYAGAAGSAIAGNEFRAAPPTEAVQLADRVLRHWRLRSPLRADLATLDRIHRSYLLHVPFENVTKLLKVSRVRTPAEARRGAAEFWRDHLQWGAGGTCFAATNAFRSLLRQVGFRSRFLFCRLPGEGDRAHTALLVRTEEGPCLVDVGYALPVPVPIHAARVARRRTPYYDVEVRRGPGREIHVFTEDERGVRFRYRLDGAGISTAQFKTAWLDTFRPEAAYMRRLALGRFGSNARYLYKDPSQLYVLTRREQTLIRITEPRHEFLSRTFGLPAGWIGEAARFARVNAALAAHRSRE